MTIQGYLFKRQLPSWSGLDNVYRFRYRLRSNDGNQTSAWTPFYEIPAEPVIAGTGNVSTGSGTASVSWNDINDFGSYSVFTYDLHDGVSYSWDLATYVNVGSYGTEKSVQVAIHGSAGQFDVFIQAPVYPTNQIFSTDGVTGTYQVYKNGSQPLPIYP